MKRILHIVGARPNFMKISPIIREMEKYPEKFEQRLVHTGQHYDANMSQIFFDELEMPKPDMNLEVGSGSHAWQTSKIMQRFESVLLDYKPDWVFVPGDVNSTLACALVASKVGIKVAHIEAGLRSFDWTMPEEINRVLTDRLADLLFITEASANRNLIREGISENNIHFVGNTMIDTLVRLLPKAEDRWEDMKMRFNLNTYALVTLHRPSNVDDLNILSEILSALNQISQKIPIIFPIHPRTRQRIVDNGFLIKTKNIHLINPLGYLEFLALQIHASLVITDSGGIQEETTYLGVPCLTVRANTERPVTIEVGTNTLVASNANALFNSVKIILENTQEGTYKRPNLWDGMSAKRIVKVIIDLHDNKP